MRKTGATVWRGDRLWVSGDAHRALLGARTCESPALLCPAVAQSYLLNRGCPDDGTVARRHRRPCRWTASTALSLNGVDGTVAGRRRRNCRSTTDMPPRRSLGRVASTSGGQTRRSGAPSGAVGARLWSSTLGIPDYFNRSAVTR